MPRPSPTLSDAELIVAIKAEPLPEHRVEILPPLQPQLHRVEIAPTRPSIHAAEGHYCEVLVNHPVEITDAWLRIAAARAEISLNAGCSVWLSSPDPQLCEMVRFALLRFMDVRRIGWRSPVWGAA